MLPIKKKCTLEKTAGKKQTKSESKTIFKKPGLLILDFLTLAFLWLLQLSIYKAHLLWQMVILGINGDNHHHLLI